MSTRTSHPLRRRPLASADFYASPLGKPPVEPTFVMFARGSGVMWGCGRATPCSPWPRAPREAASWPSRLPMPRPCTPPTADWKKRGLTIAQEPAEGPAHTFVALDPDGHRLRVFAPSARVEEAASSTRLERSASLDSSSPSPQDAGLLSGGPHGLRAERQRRTTWSAARFMREHVDARRGPYWAESPGGQGGDWRTWKVPPVMEELKARARGGLWNLFLPDDELGAGYRRSSTRRWPRRWAAACIAPEVFNCNAPDTGNMEVLLEVRHAGAEGALARAAARRARSARRSA